MRPFDPRLVRHARATRGYLVVCVGIGIAAALLIVAQAALLADAISAVFLDHRPVGATLAALAGVVAGRALLAWAQEWAAHRAAAAVKSQLRERLLRQLVRLGPGWLTGQRAGELATLSTRGIDALDGYFARYLPQLVLAAVVPAIVLARLAGADLLATATIALTLPLIPVFMTLIGWTAQARERRQFALLARLAHHFLDVVAGLPTLKVFGRAKVQAQTIRRVTDQYRRETLRTLRTAFLSSLVLELVATISVALVAVMVGLRLLDGRLDLRTALLVLILAPEAYLPLRMVGTHFHASTEGLAAAERVFSVLEEQPPPRGTRTAVPSGRIVLSGVRVDYPGRSVPALDGASLTIAPGSVVVLTGPSGCGKSTLLGVLLGFVTPDDGRVCVGGVDLATVDPDAWRRQVVWVSQRPHLFAGTVADNIRLGRPDASDEAVREAARLALASDFLDAVVGDGGAGLSAGQRQRVALARAFLSDAPVVLLDEPTANLDRGTEAAVLDAIRGLARGRTVVLVAHRPALLGVADRVVRMEHGRVVEQTPAPVVVSTAATRTPSHLASPTTDRETPPRWPVWRLLRLAAPVGPRLGLAVLCGVLAAGSAVGLTATAAWLISRAAQHPPVLYLTVAIVGVRTFGIARGVFRYLERLTGHDAALRVLALLRVRTYERLERLAPAGLPVLRAGDLVSRFVADVDAALDILVRAVLPYLVAVLIGAAAVGLVGTLLPAAGAALALGLLLVAVGVPLVQHAAARHADRRTAPLRGELCTAVVDLLHGLPDLLAYGAARRRLDALADIEVRLRRATARSAAGVGLGAGLVALAGGGSVWAALAWGADAVPAGRLDGVLLAVVVLTPLAVFDTVTGLPTAAANLASARTALSRVFGLLDRPEPVSEPAHPVPLPAPPYRLDVAGLSARWSPDGPDVIAELDLAVAPGRRVAVVGPSGSGKSTLAAVLVRFLEPSAGQVRLGGVDTRTLTGDEVRTVVGLLTDEARLFDTTIAENLRIADRDADDRRLRAALAQARLLDWVDSLPAGLDTMVGEHGARLSGGQRRRLALARVLLADFPILVLDEPTEHLDEPTARALTADLLDATRGRTTVLITHRPITLDDVDDIVTLDRRSGAILMTALRTGRAAAAGWTGAGRRRPR